MAITVADVINIHPFVPNPDVASPYPVGIWKAARTTVTDATGGVWRWTAAPASLAQAYKFLWSLEGASWITSVSTADAGIYIEVYTGEVISRAGGSEVMRFATVQPHVNAYRAGFLAAPHGASPVYSLGFIHQPGGGNLNTYIMEVQNLNGQVYTGTFWGYFWNSEARRLASGPIRPGAR